MRLGQKQSRWKQQHANPLQGQKKNVDATRGYAGSPSASLWLKHMVRCVEKSTLSRELHVEVFTLKSNLCSCFCVWVDLHVPLERTHHPDIPRSRLAPIPVPTYDKKDKHCAVLQRQPSVLACAHELFWAADQCRHFCVSHLEAEARLPLEAEEPPSSLRMQVLVAQTLHVQGVGIASGDELDKKGAVQVSSLHQQVHVAQVLPIVLTSSGIAGMLGGQVVLISLVFHCCRPGQGGFARDSSGGF